MGLCFPAIALSHTAIWVYLRGIILPITSSILAFAAFAFSSFSCREFIKYEICSIRLCDRFRQAVDTL